MKKNDVIIYASIVIFMILGFILWLGNRGDENRDIDDQSVVVSTSTPKNTQYSNRPTPTGNNPGNVGKPDPSVDKAYVPITSIPSLSSLNGSIFRLTSYNGSDLPTSSKYTLSFDGGSLSAKFCNSMSGNFVLDGSLIKANNLSTTLMSCEAPQNLMEIESAFTSMLNFGARIYKSDNKIILSHSNGTVMVFTGF